MYPTAHNRCTNNGSQCFTSVIELLPDEQWHESLLFNHVRGIAAAAAATMKMKMKEKKNGLLIHFNGCPRPNLS